MYLIVAIFFLFFGFNENDFQKDIQKYLEEKLNQFEKIEFEISSLPKNLEKESIEIDNSREFRLAGSNFYLPVLISENQKAQTQSLISLKVKLFKKVLVAKENIQRGIELNPNLFEEKLMNVADLKSVPVYEKENLKEFKTRLNIKFGEILTESLIEDIPVVKRGEKVLAILKKGNVVVSFDAIARQDGTKNEIIRIVSSEKKMFKAKVIDNSSVSIVE